MSYWNFKNLAIWLPRAFSYITWERSFQSMWFLQNHKDNYGGSWKKKNSILQGLPYWGGSGSPPHQAKIYSFPHLENPPQPNVYPPPSTKQQFSSYNLIKTVSIFSCRHYSSSVFVLISYSLDTQVMLILILIDVQYSKKAVFSFEKSLNRQNHSSSGSLHLVKKFPQ